MKRFAFLLMCIGISLWISPLENYAQSNIETPQAHFGFQPGSDGNLFGYGELMDYLKKLDDASPRIQLENIGTSPMGKPIYIAFISSEQNIRNLPRYREINRKLALDPGLTAGERKNLISEGRVFVLATLSMHSSEVGPSQSAPLIAYEMITSSYPKLRSYLDEVVYMMVPCHNPDGMDMVVNNYHKYKDTPFEGASLPAVYHKYVGHDNNRDFVTLSQEDNKAIARIYNQTWFPQVMVEKHQMGSTGTRYFVPPNHDPIAENVPAGIFSWSGIFGQNMANDMTRENLAGVSQHYLFDDYWPGSTETCIWKNVIGFLTEAASARLAKPIYIEPNELRVRGKGLSEYKKSINMLMPWEGGWWRLSDIIEYEIVSTRSIIKTAALHREDILTFRNDICRDMVTMGKTRPPFYYMMPRKQHDPGELVKLVALLKEHGVDVYELDRELTLEGRVCYPGDVVVPLAQPFRAFIKEVMEEQEFPERHYTPDGELIKPYDITSWSLPLHRHVESHEIGIRSTALEEAIQVIEGPYDLSKPLDKDAKAVVLPVEYNESYRTAFSALAEGFRVERVTESLNTGQQTVSKGSFVIEVSDRKRAELEKLLGGYPVPHRKLTGMGGISTRELTLPRIALVETYFHDMDAGWTRFILDQYHIPFDALKPHEIKEADLQGDYDVVLIPDTDKNLLLEGKYKSGDRYYLGNYHPDYVKGMEKEGLKNLVSYLDEGGNIVCWGRSSALFEGVLTFKEGEEKEEFQLPFRDISGELRKDGLYIPGSLVEINLLQDHPLTLGMPATTGVFSRGRPVFQTGIPGFDTDRRVIATYPEKEILMSGYARNEKEMGLKSAMIWLKKGEGEMVLFGFQPQFRASTQSSFKLLFNSILL